MVKSSDQGIIFVIKILNPDCKCINRHYKSDYPLLAESPATTKEVTRAPNLVNRHFVIVITKTFCHFEWGH